MDFIRDLARRTEAGDFGRGRERQINLGPFYGMVQNQVNEALGYPKRYPNELEMMKRNNILNI